LLEPLPGNFDLTKGQLQLLLGGNYFVRKKYDVRLLALWPGTFPASPRVGVVLGLTMGVLETLFARLWGNGQKPKTRVQSPGSQINTVAFRQKT